MQVTSDQMLVARALKNIRVSKRLTSDYNGDDA